MFDEACLEVYRAPAGDRQPETARVGPAFGPGNSRPSEKSERSDDGCYEEPVRKVTEKGSPSCVPI
jgi:hypothetical protein